MADRYFKQYRLSLETAIVSLYGKVVTGSTGAITVADTSTKGFAVTRTAAGEYKVKLEDNYNELKSVNVTVSGPNSGDYTTAKGMPYFLRQGTGGETLRTDTDGLQFVVRQRHSTTGQGACVDHGVDGAGMSQATESDREEPDVKSCVMGHQHARRIAQEPCKTGQHLLDAGLSSHHLIGDAMDLSNTGWDIAPGID